MITFASFPSSVPEWRNWQTRTVQGRVRSGECGFDPHLRHLPGPSPISRGKSGLSSFYRSRGFEASPPKRFLWPSASMRPPSEGMIRMGPKRVQTR